VRFERIDVDVAPVAFVQAKRLLRRQFIDTAQLPGQTLGAAAGIVFLILVQTGYLYRMRNRLG
jgi:hypothetical protein